MPILTHFPRCFLMGCFTKCQFTQFSVLSCSLQLYGCFGKKSEEKNSFNHRIIWHSMCIRMASLSSTAIAAYSRRINEASGNAEQLFYGSLDIIQISMRRALSSREPCDNHHLHSAAPCNLAYPSSPALLIDFPSLSFVCDAWEYDIIRQQQLTWE